MYYQQTTQIPNEIIEAIPNLKLSGAQVKLLLIFYRATWGWHKKRDRLTYSELIRRSGLGHRIIASSIQCLIDQNLLKVTDYQGHELHTPNERRGKLYLYYTPLRLTNALSSAKNSTNMQKQVQKGEHNKTNGTKPNSTQVISNQGTKKLTDSERIQQILLEQKNRKS